MATGLSNLPCEVISIVNSYCGQADTVNFAIALPEKCDFIVSQLYHSIIVDTGPCSLVRPYKNVGGRFIPCTVLRTVAGINQFLHVLKSHPKLAAKVWAFECRSNVGLSDSQFLTDVRAVFNKLTSLTMLEWSACPELPPELLCVLPNPECLHLLRADLAVRPWESYAPLKFSNLQVLEVRPFLNGRFLVWLSQATANSPLSSITLERFLDSKLEIGSGYAFVGLSNSEHVNIETFFRNKRLRPRKLGVVGAEIGVKVMDDVDFSHVEDLTLVGNADSDSSILLALQSRIPRVRSLRLDWPKWTPAFLKQLRLENLDITVKHLPSDALMAIGEQIHLQTLALRIDCPFTVADLKPLRELSKLTKLTLPFNYDLRTWEIALALPYLKTLVLNYQTFVTGRPSRANVGLLNSGVYDGWSDRDVSPLQNSGILTSLQSHPSLKAIIINGRTTTFRNYE